MPNEPIISISGLRGVIGETLDPIVAANYASAYAAEAPDGPIVLSRDGRATGTMLSNTISGALAAAGRDVIYADVAATPTAGVLIRHIKAAGGIQISASHNPPEYNGMKLFASNGRIIGAEAGQRVLDRYRSGNIPWTSHDSIGTISTLDNVHDPHLQLVLSTVDVESIRKQAFRVLLDSNNGSGSVLGKQLLTELGCEVLAVGDTPDGIFGHTPEPTEVNLGGIADRVRDENVVAGFCQDPDADRLAMIDETGRYIGEEYTVSIVVNHRLSQTKGPIVTNCSTSRMAQDLAEQNGVPFFRSKVGEANVCDLMIAKEAVFGGEGSGGPIDPRVGFVRDSFVGMAMTLDAMAATGKSLSQLTDELPRYEIYKTKATVASDAVASVFDKLEAHFSDAAPDRLDGLRLDWDDKWLLVRASNTEPIVRFIAEAKTIAAAKDVCDIAMSLV